MKIKLYAKQMLQNQWLGLVFTIIISNLSDHQGHLLLTWVSNYVYYILWDEITYPFPNLVKHLGMDKKFYLT